LVDLNLVEKKVLLIGGGLVGERRAKKIAKECHNIIVVSNNFTHGLKHMHENKQVNLVLLDVFNNSSLLDRMISRSDIVLAVTDNHTLNRDISDRAKKGGALVYTSDDHSHSDFSFPSISTFRNIQVAVYTGGRSPIMSKILNKKIKKIIKENDLLQIDLQAYARNILKSKNLDNKSRRKILYKIVQDAKVGRLLKNGFFDEAKIIANEIIKRG
jgi:precorrin-2 dehydrogenase/sirohydrochlorin ferrochelatase